MPDQDLLSVPLVISTHATDAALVTSKDVFIRHNIADQKNRLIFVKEGTLQMFIGGSEYDLEKDHVIIIKAGTPFTRIHSSTSLLRYYALRFSVNEKSAQSGQNIELPFVVTLSRSDLVENLFRLFLDEQSDANVDQSFAQLLFQLMLVEVADYKHIRGISKTHSIPLVERAKAHVRAHYDRQISTMTIAKSIDCSPDYLSRVFQQSTGATLTAFIHEVRIFRAQIYLTETNKPIYRIAVECGFENVSYFQRLFRRYTGKTPGAYRKERSGIYTINIE